MSRVSVVVPFRPGYDLQRDRVWDHIRGLWRDRYPSWPVYEASDQPGPWRKGLAVQRALAQAPDGLVIIADADVWAPSILQSVAAVEQGAKWSMPYRKLIRLNKLATDLILNGESTINRIGLVKGAWAEKPYYQETAGGMVVLRRQLALDVPIDPNFAGWGGEDMAWAIALQAIVGPRHRIEASTLYHLWHEPQKRQNRVLGSPENTELLRLYGKARNSPDLMGRLIARAKAFGK